MRRGEGSSRVVHEYDFFDENRTGPRRSHIAPPLPLFAMRSIVNEDEAKMMFVKTLEFWDVHHCPTSLSLRSEEMMLRTLKQEERSKLARKGFLEVPMLDPSGNGYNMWLHHRPWAREAAMSGEWYKLVKTNHLKIGDKIEGWAVRGEDGRLRCVLTLMHRVN